MITSYDIGLAEVADVPEIAALSRHAIEHNLAWRWTPLRVMRSLRDHSTNIVVSRQADRLIGFAILRYLDNEAHLLLLAVQVSHRRRGVATQLIDWLCDTLRVAGIAEMQLEARAGNAGALAFYRHLGFQQTGVRAGYYEGGEDAVQMSKYLRPTAAAD